jgi:signal transduction histidine kinase
VAVLFEDVTVRKKAEERRAFLAALMESLAPLRDEAAILRAATQAVGKMLRVDRCHFVEFAEAQERVVVSENYLRGDSPSLAGEISLREFGGIDWWRRMSGQAVAVPDVATHPLTRDRRAAYEARKVRSYVSQPFASEGPVRALLVVTDTVPREWTGDELKLLEDVMVRAWALVERARNDRALMQAHGALEARVAERTAKLQETISELESYSYSISHDLRAPLRAMQTYASILVNEHATAVDAEGKEYLRRIMVASERMDRLIRDVLVYSRLAREEMALERIELGSFIASLIESYPGLNAARAEIEVVSPLAPVNANPAGLTQCISNLVGNAIKFVAPGVKPRIRIWSEIVGGRVRLFIRDNGIGIPLEAQGKIFAMFYQEDSSADGTGVGLAVVKRAAERMSGAIGVTSAPDQGSTFWLELNPAPGPVPL